MARLLDTNLWVGFTRTRSPRSLKTFLAPFILDPQACLADPVVFEMLRNASDVESRQLISHFQTLPLRSAPIELWSLAVELGRACRRNGTPVGSIDLLIATIAIYHRAELVTFDADFEKVASISKLRVHLLKYPKP